MGTTLITFPKSPFLDMKTGLPSREWMQWLQNPNVINITIGGGGALSVASGGTGLSTIPGPQQILIGNGTGYSLGTISSILPAFTGDASTTFGNTVITFATVNNNVGSFGSPSSSTQFTVNAKGLITAASVVPIAITSGAVSGTITNDLAAAGVIGEYISASVVSGSAISLTTSVAANVTNIALTAGDWNVSGVIGFQGSGTTNVTYLQSSISSVSATNGTLGQLSALSPVAVIPSDQLVATPSVRISLAAPATIYLVAQGNFTVSTLKAYGFISARRAR